MGILHLIFPKNYAIELSYLGFVTQVIQVTDSSQEINVSMIEGNDLLEEVIISANRAEKIQDAPASFSLITARDIQNSSEAIDPVRHYKYSELAVQQQATNTMNIEMRGGNGLFGTGVYPMLITMLQLQLQDLLPIRLDFQTLI